MTNEGKIYIDLDEEHKVSLEKLLKSISFKKFVEKQGFTIKDGRMYSSVDNKATATDEITRLAKLAYGGKDMIDVYDRMTELEDKLDENSKKYSTLENKLNEMCGSINDFKNGVYKKLDDLANGVYKETKDKVKIDSIEDKNNESPEENKSTNYGQFKKKEDSSKPSEKPKSLEENIEDFKSEQEKRSNRYKVKDKLDELERYYENMIKEGTEGQKNIKNLKKTLCNKEDNNIAGICGKAAYYTGYGIGYGIGTILGAGIGIIGGLFGAIVDIGDNAYNNLDKKLKEIKPHY